MKAMIRLVMILLAAIAVVGATWAVGQASSSDNESAFVQGERPAVGESGDFSPPAGVEGREGGDAHAAQVTSLRGWLGFAKTLAPIALIITLVTLPMSLWKRYRRTHKHPAPAAVG